MAKTKLGAGQVVDTLTQGELDASLDRQTRDWFQEQARGFSTARFASIGTVDSTDVTVPQSGAEPIGPDTGFAWTVQRLSVVNLGDGDVLRIYRNSVTDFNFIDQVTDTAPSVHFGSKGLVLRAEERLILVGTGLAATGDVIVNGEAIEVAELDLYKIL